MTAVCLTGVSSRSMSKRQTTQSEANETEKSWEDIAKDALCNSEGNSTAVLDALSAYIPDINWFVSVIR